MPVTSLGAFSEYVAIPENAVAHIPVGLDFAVASAIPLPGLTAYQPITEELHAKEEETLCIAFGNAGAPLLSLARLLAMYLI